MSERYLANEARWARQQALDVAHKLDALRDPFSLEKLRQKASLDLTQLKYRHRAEKATQEAEIRDLTDGLDDRIERLERDRKYWQDLAEGHEARLSMKDDDALFTDTT